MKAIIPVAGTGAKLRPHTYTQPKALLPVAGKTVLDFTVEQLKNAGIREFIFIIGYLGGKVQEHVNEKYPDLICHFVQQDKREGTGHAIILAKEIVANDELIIVMGDTITDFDVAEVINADKTMIAVKRVDDPRGFGVVQLKADGYISHLEEKPAIPMSNTALVGVYRIKETNILFECLDTLFSDNIKTHGQYHLTDALQCMISKGVRMKSFGVRRWYDCGRKDTLLETNAFLLKHQSMGIHESVTTERSIIIAPVSIGANCVIEGSIIGPHISVGENTIISNSIARDSIIGSYAKLEDMVIYNSLIGSDVSLHGSGKSLNVGDNTEIDFNK
ncbi:sugar phosphate nucleotidyltransferase [Haoranjiania flava]|uniref:Sugar phosphate nucleotidyltransferase n=1 Tax=Haoranjiania flava TaxID=1856322 RepID=A0AAE3LJD1_9BACT|nr:sugar phosphate nucleotidyltransferase [Haoranjiania flava]MCU7693269.1 sugar phosphate nucleotidyltransferase [Haoranjiania flava]